MYEISGAIKYGDNLLYLSIGKGFKMLNAGEHNFHSFFSQTGGEKGDFFSFIKGYLV